MNKTLSILDRLEGESLQIFREVEADCNNPVLMFSSGKDSAVLLHLAQKAFFPSKIPFPILHIDTTWKFKEMISFRDETISQMGLDLITRSNKEAIEEGVDPLSHEAGYYTTRMKTEPLKKVLREKGFDVAFGGARREEETSRAKERICSWRSVNQTWEPRSQRPEPWNLFNTRLKEGESFRVFPLSNWTEANIWDYIQREKIKVPSLYLASLRPTILREGLLIVVDDDRLSLRPGEKVVVKKVRFRSLGCYPLTAAHLSEAETLEDLIAELQTGKMSERHGRVIDKDIKNSMEIKKREGYF